MATKKILITGARSPVALHLARLLGTAGYEVIVADVQKNAITQHSRFVKAYERFVSPVDDFDKFTLDIKKIVQAYNIDLVIPTCEEVFWIAQAWQKLGLPLNQLFCPSFQTLLTAHNKFKFQEQLAKFCLPHLPSQQVSVTEDVLKYEDKDVVLKPVWSRFASQVLILPKANHLQKLNISSDNPYVVQPYIKGKEICAYAVAVNGKRMALSCYHPKYRAGLGAGIYFEPNDNIKIAKFVDEYCKLTNWTGQISFDIIVDDYGDIWPLECNPRATSGLHLFLDGNLFRNALEGKESVAVPSENAQCVKLAMWVYGYRYFETLGRYVKDMRAASEALYWPDDKLTFIHQLGAVLEYTKIAIQNRQTLQQASTSDIEWNGEMML